MRGWIAIGFAAACYQPANLENCTVPCGPNRECPQGYACASNNLCASNGTCSVLPADGGPDGPCMRFGHGLFEPCVPPASIMPQLDVSAGNIATLPDASDPCVTYLQTDMTQVCVLAYQAISIRGGVTLTGTIPVVLIGADSVTVDTTGSIDAASHRGGGIGPGSNPSTCTTENGDSSQSGGGGGAGGTFGALSGGSGGNALDMAAAGGLPALPVGPPYTIRGGCSGGAGGAGTGTPAMTGGAGGGAVMLMSSGPITIAGIVNASGAGAAIALASAGGNGGGAGGFIGLDSDSALYTVTGTMCALGGGGSSGAESASATTPGLDATPSAAGQHCIPGTGGPGNGGGDGAGGAGATTGKSAAPGSDATMTLCGGGGGGGGVGAIVTVGVGPIGPSAIDPPPTSQ